MKTLAFFIISTLLPTLMSQASVSVIGDSTSSTHIVCVATDVKTTLSASNEQISTGKCLCSEVADYPEIIIKNDPLHHQIRVLGALTNDEIYILNEKGEILMYQVAGQDNPVIDISSLSAGFYTIGVQHPDASI